MWLCALTGASKEFHRLCASKELLCDLIGVGVATSYHTLSFLHCEETRRMVLFQYNSFSFTVNVNMKASPRDPKLVLICFLYILQQVQKSSSDDLAKLSDAWEFQENEIMNAQGRLRSIRAKLSVLEGKMVLAIMYPPGTIQLMCHIYIDRSIDYLNLDHFTSFSPRDAHKVVEENQKKINNAQKALQILKTTCVVWPNKASEVLLTGSFDGWSTKV